MKKVLIIAGILAASISCQKINDITVSDPENTHLEVNINVDETETKGVKTAWANGDRIYLFFTGQRGYLEIKRVSGVWTAQSWSDGLEAIIAGTTSGTLSAVYSPVTKFGGSIKFSTNFHFYCYSGGIYHGYVLEHKKASYSISAGVLSASVNLTAPKTYVQFCLSDGGTFHHRNGTAINVNNYGEVSRYKLQVGFGNTTWCNDKWSAGITGEFYHGDNGSEINAYSQNGLCFSIPDQTVDQNTLKLTLTDSETSKTYVYTSPVKASSWNSKTTHAFRVPDLNAMDGGVYKWVEQ
jgi:hypothetical protein